MIEKARKIVPQLVGAIEIFHWQFVQKWKKLLYWMKVINEAKWSISTREKELVGLEGWQNKDEFIY